MQFWAWIEGTSLVAFYLSIDISSPNLCVKMEYSCSITCFALFSVERLGQLWLKSIICVKSIIKPWLHCYQLNQHRNITDYVIIDKPQTIIELKRQFKVNNLTTSAKSLYKITWWRLAVCWITRFVLNRWTIARSAIRTWERTIAGSNTNLYTITCYSATIPRRPSWPATVHSCIRSRE